MAFASRFFRPALLAACLAGGAAVLAQTPALVQAPPKNVLSLSAEASQEVAQDLLSITLSTTKEGGDASGVQSQLRQALDAALTEARKVAQPKLLEVRTGAFSIAPRYAAKPGGSGNTITGWQGRAELVIEGSDTAAISQLAGRLTSLTVARVGFGLSREARERAEAEVAAQAITRFKGRAESYARQFGFGGYSLREVAVGSGDVATAVPNYRVRALSAAMADEAQPVEAGKSLVTVNVSGSIELTPR
jgi:predicted secreted protein